MGVGVSESTDEKLQGPRGEASHGNAATREREWPVTPNGSTRVRGGGEAHSAFAGLSAEEVARCSGTKARPNAASGEPDGGGVADAAAVTNWLLGISGHEASDAVSVVTDAVDGAGVEAAGRDASAAAVSGAAAGVTSRSADSCARGGGGSDGDAESAYGIRASAVGATSAGAGVTEPSARSSSGWSEAGSRAHAAASGAAAAGAAAGGAAAVAGAAGGAAVAGAADGAAASSTLAVAASSFTIWALASSSAKRRLVRSVCGWTAPDALPSLARAMGGEVGFASGELLPSCFREP